MSETVDMSKGQCPDCGIVLFHPGPRGGMAINVKCSGCGHCFNYCWPLPSHRIAETPGVYADHTTLLSAVNTWVPERERMLTSMRRTLEYMRQKGVPPALLIDVLDVCLQELRREIQ